MLTDIFTLINPHPHHTSLAPCFRFFHHFVQDFSDQIAFPSTSRSQKQNTVAIPSRCYICHIIFVCSCIRVNTDSTYTYDVLYNPPVVEHHYRTSKSLTSKISRTNSIDGNFVPCKCETLLKRWIYAKIMAKMKRNIKNIFFMLQMDTIGQHTNINLF